MTPTADSPHRFSVHARHIGAHSARIVEEGSFEAAAIAYLEDISPEVSVGSEISVVVRDIATGREHCYRVDLESGDTAPCG